MWNLSIKAQRQRDGVRVNQTRAEMFFIHAKYCLNTHLSEVFCKTPVTHHAQSNPRVVISKTKIELISIPLAKISVSCLEKINLIKKIRDAKLIIIKIQGWISIKNLLKSKEKSRWVILELVKNLERDGLGACIWLNKNKQGHFLPWKWWILSKLKSRGWRDK